MSEVTRILTVIEQGDSHAAEEEALRRCVQRGAPFGSAGWVERMARRYGLHTTLRPRGRPKKETDNGS